MTPLIKPERTLEEWQRKCETGVNATAKLLTQQGPTTARPAAPVVGQMFYDTTLGKPSLASLNGRLEGCQRNDGMIDWAGYLEWKPAFFEAIDTRMYSPEWLDGMVQSGRAQVWRSANACALTELQFYPTGVADLHGLVAAGDIEEVRDILVPQAEASPARCGAPGSSSRAAPVGRSY
jgi:hypothetical protein